jgi:LuxR family transcriptional regulator, regulator of acetate metabolism
MDERLPDDLAAARTALVRDVVRTLGAIEGSEEVHPGGAAATSLALAHTIRESILSSLNDADTDLTQRRSELVDLLVRAGRFEGTLLGYVESQRVQQRAALSRNMARLRACADSFQLGQHAAEVALDALGARRVAVSRVRDGVWSPWRMTSIEELGSLTAWGERGPMVLEHLPVEQAVVATRQTGLTIAPARSKASSAHALRTCVVGPIVVENEVIGLLHVEFGDYEPGADLRQMLGRVHEQLTTREQFGGQRSAAEDLQRAAQCATLLDADVELSIDPLRIAGDSRSAAQVPDVDSSRANLTARQRETLDLVLRGYTNAEIAERLIVSVATVKSHVRAILHRVGAVNRAEAIARYVAQDRSRG